MTINLTYDASVAADFGPNNFGNGSHDYMPYDLALLPGDANLDGTVNGTDLNVVLSNYNQTLAAGAAVPEPSAIVFLGVGAVSLLGYAWRRRT